MNFTERKQAFRHYQHPCDLSTRPQQKVAHLNAPFHRPISCLFNVNLKIVCNKSINAGFPPHQTPHSFSPQVVVVRDTACSGPVLRLPTILTNPCSSQHYFPLEVLLALAIFTVLWLSSRFSHFFRRPFPSWRRESPFRRHEKAVGDTLTATP